MYLVRGSRMKKIPSESEYSHQNGYARTFTGKNDPRNDPVVPVRKLPVPLAPAVRLSAMNLPGNISHSETIAILTRADKGTFPAEHAFTYLFLNYFVLTSL